MKPSDFFIEQQDPDWALKSHDPWATSMVFDIQTVEGLRQAPPEGISDLEVAQALTKLVADELVAYGTDSSHKLQDEEIGLALWSLRLVLQRVGIAFSVPFRDFTSFRTHWLKQGMSHSWQARREYVQGVFEPIMVQLDAIEDRQAVGAIRGVDGALKNIIFASSGSKPRIVLRDAINNIIEVTDNAKSCLFYDRPLGDAGLTWGELVDWWRSLHSFGKVSDLEVGRHLYDRLCKSLASPPEKLLFKTYCSRFSEPEAANLPALLPQVYLHYDPQTRYERGGRDSVLKRERMDFLMLLPRGVRIVIEVDGKQHYAEGDAASPRLYSEMVKEDRRIRLKGYEVYRFGGYELDPRFGPAVATVGAFFTSLLDRHTTSA